LADFTADDHSQAKPPFFKNGGFFVFFGFGIRIKKSAFPEKGRRGDACQRRRRIVLG